MKRMMLVLVPVLVLALISFSVLAGDIKVKIDRQEPVDNEAQTLNPEYFGIKGNGGPMVGLIWLDLAELNKAIINVNYEGGGFAPLDERMVLFGGGGLGGLKKGGRFGGYGLKGEVNSSRGDKEAILSLSYGGFLYEYGIFSEGKTDIAVGTLLGGGNTELDLIYERPTSFPGDPVMNIYKKDFILINPQVTLHRQLAAFLGLDLSLGYLLTYDFGDEWKIGDYEIDGPLDNLHGPTLNLKLSFGF